MPHPTVASSVQKMTDDLPNRCANGTRIRGPAATPAIAAETYKIASSAIFNRAVNASMATSGLIQHTTSPPRFCGRPSLVPPTQVDSQELRHCSQTQPNTK